ncbi:helix-turn-helix transcriptional regulator [Bengtsoniella intestinalis]|uniref:helix-turn-helix transcriptional regulator n=1 Tax=Bengtsoniella intestinalis TaxID=3073143 RepID=UPI00391F6008
MPLQNNIKQYREQSSLNQTELAKICDVSRQTISSIERGDYHPSIVLALKLAQYFSVTVEDLFSYQEDLHE